MVSIPKKSQYRIIFDSLLDSRFELIISNEILSEYHEIIEQKTNNIVANNICEMLLTLKNVSKQEIYFRWNLVDADKDDNKFIDCAIAGSADYVVSNDKHFNNIKNMDFPKLNIITINEFIPLL